MNYGCPLCTLAQGNIVTKLYYLDDLIVVADCEISSSEKKPVPIGIIKKHKMGLNPAEHRRLTTVMLGVGEKVFGRGKFYIDRKSFYEEAHLHWFVRPKEPK